MDQVSRISCPLPSCAWQLHIRQPSESSAAFAPMFGISVMDASAYAEHVQRVEKQLREHFAGHTSEEWVAEIVRLNSKLKEWDDHLC